MLSRYLTAKITNAEELTNTLGRQEAGYVVRHALRRIARDARMGGGQIDKITATRVVVGFPNHEQAATMALKIDSAINELPVGQGMRLHSAVFVAERDEASRWQQSQYEMFRGADRAPPAVEIQRATLHFGDKIFVLDAQHPVITIGRHDDNTIVVNHAWVSRHHAKITWSEGKVLIADCSSNRTYVRYADDGREVKIWRDEWQVNRDATITFGMHMAVANGKPVQIDLRFD